MKRRPPVRWVLSVVAVVAIGLASGWLFQRTPPAAPSSDGRETRHADPETSPASDRSTFADWTDGDGVARRDVAPNDDQPPKHTNRLAKETSPYLLLHRHNPVEWYPWGAEAYEKARRENKPIFLSIGYSSCHWCHVMERESFADEEIAKILNEHFVCIKVDREELPDVDEMYMNAVQMLPEGRGGWPLSAFLTPDLKPFFGGTYFPPVDRGRLPAFSTVLQFVIGFWKDHRDQAEQRGERVMDLLRQYNRPRGFALGKLDREIADHTVNGLVARFDPEYGGFGYRADEPMIPKFPQPPTLEFLAYMARQQDDARARAMLLLTLDRIGRGGIRDHLGGGFHRYSTDRFWQVPHFEKMLYDNAQLTRVYLDAFEFTSDRNYADLAKLAFAFVAREMTSPDGGFYSALDADSDDEEGKYYVWTAKEVKALLSPREHDLFTAVCGMSGAPQMREPGQPGRYVLQLEAALPDLAARQNVPAGELVGLLEPAFLKLIAARNKRARPLTDTKIMTDWNALMIAALADGFRVLKDDAYRAAAERSAELILSKCRSADGQLLHIVPAGSAKVSAYLIDYAFLTRAMLALNRATGDERWLREARSLADQMLKLFWDDSAGGFFDTAAEQQSVLVRFKSSHDGVLPSGNGAAVRALVELAVRTGEGRYAELAGRSLASFAGVLAVDPNECPNMVLGLCEYLDAKLPDAHLTARSRPSIVSADAFVSVDKLRPGREFQVAVVASINSEYHIYANPPSKRDFLPTTLAVTSDLELEDVRVKYPAARQFRAEGVDEAINVYNGQALIRATVRLSDKTNANAGELRLALRFQACNNQRCLAPQTLEIVVPVEVAGPDEPVKALRPDIFGPPQE